MATSLNTGKLLPTPQTQIVDPKTGFLAEDGVKYLNNLINQLAQAAPTATVTTGIQAAGTTQATATPLPSQWNEVDSATAANAGVLLGALQQGQTQVVVNVSGVAINIYPQAGGRINALGVNQPFSLANGARATFQFFTPTQVRT